MTADLDIYVERLRTFRAARDYTLTLLLPRLRQAGGEYRILDRFDPTDSGRRALLHIDLTDVPDEFSRVAESYEKTINGRALTIRRTLYSTARLRPGDDYRGPVIVKTVLNSGGYPELRYRKNRNVVSRVAHGIGKLVRPGYKRRICPPYEVYESAGGVSDQTWRDERLIVEKFVPGSLFLPIVKYRYCFLFDTTLTLKSTCDDLLCTSATVRSNEIIESVPDEVVAVRRCLDLDFGAIDYFMVDGEAVVIDANKTVSTALAWMARYECVREYVDRLERTLISFAMD